MNECKLPAAPPTRNLAISIRPPENARGHLQSLAQDLEQPLSAVATMCCQLGLERVRENLRRLRREAAA